MALIDNNRNNMIMKYENDGKNLYNIYIVKLNNNIYSTIGDHKR
jgi:hypothetical protein